MSAEPRNEQIDEAVRLMRVASDFGADYGHLHIAIADGNMDDVNLACCELEVLGNAEGHGADYIAAEVASLAALKALTEDERYEAYELLWPGP